jgi:hypothetical protein
MARRAEQEAAPTSLRLAWEDGGTPPADVPLRDLDAADLCRVHRIRALRASGGEPVDAPTPVELEAIAAELAATGAWSREPTPTREPAAPADKE